MRGESRAFTSVSLAFLSLSPRLLSFYDLKFFPLFQGKPETNARHVSSTSAPI